MIQLVASPWEGYELLATGDGKRLERFGQHTIVRPDPNVIWPIAKPISQAWSRPDAVFTNGKDGWQASERLAAGWSLPYNRLRFIVRPTPFRHVGLFPEQSAHWEWLEQSIRRAKSTQPVRVLNLFGYTGAASVVAAAAGATVCHVDASRGMVQWGKENAAASGLSDTAIRWIVEDALKFMRREVRRGNKYDIILMDPPVFGRGPKGEIWRLEEQLSELIQVTGQLLSDTPRGLLLNWYATALYPESVVRLMDQHLGARFPKQEWGSLVLQESDGKNVLGTGFFYRSSFL